MCVGVGVFFFFFFFFLPGCACYWRLCHNHANPTTYTTTNPHQYPVERGPLPNPDVEAPVQEPEAAGRNIKYDAQHNTWLFVFFLLLLLLISLVTSVVGMFLDILRFVMIWTSRIGLVNSSWLLRFEIQRRTTQRTYALRPKAGHPHRPVGW